MGETALKFNLTENTIKPTKQQHSSIPKYTRLIFFFYVDVMIHKTLKFLSINNTDTVVTTLSTAEVAEIAYGNLYSI